ncbi:hypothetical protein [Amycolatopsis panacis]|uniref:Uncharacterized protein n=1 Tax=Amycolatopsis panacis TaxID=2340917 RepID=A0A419I4S4_9PSEU|nr:hypothetical protein [Amycolatopsis panacis]RJQ85493.1 hypothetical protein D5S19_14020 [Amycolatopsis panacis]
MSLDKPWNDVADQLRPAQPDLDSPDDEFDLVVEPVTEPIDVIEADPADQRRAGRPPRRSTVAPTAT